jgi:hypothetical protein
MFERTADGWTDLKPGPEARLYFVDAQRGNDATGRPTLAKQLRDRANPPNPFRTLAFLQDSKLAFTNTYVLLRCGQEHVGPLRLWSGAGPGRPFVAASYGPGDRPRVVPGPKGLLFLRPEGSRGRGQPEDLSHCALADIEFRDATLDPDHPMYDGRTKHSAVAYFPEKTVVQDLLIEGCRFAYCGTGFQTKLQGERQQVTMRRCLIHDNYGVDGHASGLFTHFVPLLLEECILVHNGHARHPKLQASGVGKATIFNHNAYCDPVGSTYVRNVFLWGSSMGLKLRTDTPDPGNTGLVVDDNLFLDNEFPLGCAGNTQDPGRVIRPRITNNVSLYEGASPHTGRGISWGYKLDGIEDGLVAGNIYGRQRIDRENVQPFNVDTGCVGLRILGNAVWDTVAPEAMRIRSGSATRPHEVAGNLLAVRRPSGRDARQPGAPIELMKVPAGCVAIGPNLIPGQADLGGAPTWKNIHGAAEVEAWAKKRGIPTPFDMKAARPDELQIDDLNAYAEKLLAQRRGSWDDAIMPGALNAKLRAALGMKRWEGE